MHFSVLAITPQRPDEAGLHDLLWPWCHSNPDLLYPRWDFFRAGGIYRALLDPDQTAETGERIWDVCQKQKRHLDVTALQARAVAREAKTYDGVQIALAGRRLPEIAKLRQAYGERGWVDHWHVDPAVNAVRSVAGCLSPESILSYAEPRHVALANAKRCAILTSAMVQGDRWYDSELWAWDEDPARTEAWADLSMRLIAEADSDAWLTIVDCHR